jgi:hypothetical protein
MEYSKYTLEKQLAFSQATLIFLIHRLNKVESVPEINSLRRSSFTLVGKTTDQNKYSRVTVFYSITQIEIREPLYYVGIIQDA